MHLSKPLACCVSLLLQITAIGQSLTGCSKFQSFKVSIQCSERLFTFLSQKCGYLGFLFKKNFYASLEAISLLGFSPSNHSHQEAAQGFRRLVDKERAFAQTEFEKARSAVQRVEEVVHEQRRMSQATRKQLIRM